MRKSILMIAAMMINGNTICLKPKGVESEDDCYDYDENTRTLKNEQGAVYYRQVVD